MNPLVARDLPGGRPLWWFGLSARLGLLPLRAPASRARELRPGTALPKYRKQPHAQLRDDRSEVW